MEREEKNRQDQLNKLMNDMNVSKGKEVALDADQQDERWEQEDEDEDAEYDSGKSWFQDP